MRQGSSSPLLRLVPLALGLLGLLFAIILGALNGNFMTWHFVMGGLSLLSIAGGLAWSGDGRLRDTLASTVYTVFFLLSAATVYLIAANRPQRYDLTRDKIHSLSGQTSAVLARAPGDAVLRLDLFIPQAQTFAAERFLASYKRLAPTFVYNIHDPKRDLDVVSLFSPNGAPMKEGQFYLALLDAEGVPLRRTDGALDLTNSLREHVLTNAIARVLTSDQEVIYWSTGLGEKRLDKSPESLTKVAEAVAASAVDIRELRLMEGRIPPDAAMVVIAGPKRDLSEFDLELLRNYLDQGGKLLLMLDPMFEERVAMPNFAALLKHIGLESPNAFVIDPVAVTATRVTTTPQVVWVKHPITMATNRVPFLLDRARALVSTGDVDPKMKLEGILVSNPQSWLEDVATVKSFRRATPPEDLKLVGVQVLAVSVAKDVPGGRFGNRLRAVVVGDSDAFVDAQIERNGDAGAFFLQSVNWLREREDLLQVPPRFLTATPVTVNRTTVWTLLGAFALVGLAISVGGTALAIARRRMK